MNKRYDKRYVHIDREPVGRWYCPQCEYLGLNATRATLTVFDDGSSACGLCGYREDHGMPVPSTVKVITKRGSLDT